MTAQIKLSSLRRRFCALTIDRMILFLISFLMCLAFPKLFNMTLIPERMKETVVDFLGILESLNLSQLLLGEYFTLSGLIAILMEIFYFTFFICSSSQATPGKRLMRIHVVNLDNTKIGIRLAFARAAAPFLPLFLWLVGSIIEMLMFSFIDDIARKVLTVIITVAFILIRIYWNLMAFFSKKKQTFHDVLCKTIVVRTTKQS